MSEFSTLNGFKVKDKKAIRFYDNVASMISDTTLKEGMHVKTKGYYNANDNGDAEYIIESNQSATNHQELLNNELYATLIMGDIVNIKKLGAYGDNEHDDTNVFTNAFNLNKKIYYIPSGNYIIDSKINVLDQCNKIYGDSRRTSIIVSNGDCFDFGNTSRSLFEMHDLQLRNKTTTPTGKCIKGIFSISKFNNLRIRYYEDGFYTDNGTWIDYFENILITDCTNGFNHSSNVFNNMNFINCVFQHNVNGFYINGGCEDVNIIGCNFENNSESAFNLGGGALFNADGCYFEGNTTIMKFHGAYFGSTYKISNSWMYATGITNNGWLCTARTASSLDVEYSSLDIENNYIVLNPTYKPFAFDETNTKCYLAINFVKNYIKSNPKIKEYFDLFDLTNCENYGSYTNELPIVTDLIYGKYETINVFIKNNGNRLIRGADQITKHIIGKLEIESTGQTQITLNTGGKIGKSTTTLPAFIVNVKYTDGTITNNECKVLYATTYIYNIDSTKTVSAIYFNNDY